MTLRKRTLLYAAVILASLTLVLGLIAYGLIWDLLGRWEQESVRRYLESAEAALAVRLTALSTIALDWAHWDDTYAFIVDGDQAYIDSNYYDSTFTDLGISLAALYDERGGLVYGKVVDLATGHEVPLPGPLAVDLPPDSPLLDHPDSVGGVSGFFVLPEGPVLVSSQVILPSTEDDVPRGTLVMGLEPEAVDWAGLPETARLSLLAAETVAPDVLRAAEQALTGGDPAVVRPLNEQAIAGYRLLADVSGDPAVLLYIELPREIGAQALVGFALVFLWLLLIDLLLGGALFFMVERLVLGRVTALDRDLARIAAGGERAGRVTATGGDELARLAAMINHTLDSLARSHEAVRANENRLTSVLGSAINAIIITDEALTILMFNRAAERMFGCPAAEAVGRPLGDLMPERLRDLQLAYIREAGASPPEADAMVRGVMVQGQRRGGAIFPMEASVSRSSVDDQVIYSAIIRDVSGRERTLAALQESEERFRILVEHAPDAIVVLDEHLRFVNANENAERLFGLSRDELLHLGLVAVSPPVQEDGRSSAEVAAEYFHLALAGEAPVFEWLHRDAAGRVIRCEIRLARLPATGQLLVRGSIMDISAPKQSERLLRGQRALLEQLAAGASLTEVLTRLIELLESFMEGASGAVFLCDKRTTTWEEAIAPRLPAAFVQALAALPRAALPGGADPEEPVIVPDLAADSRCDERFRDLAVASGLRASLSCAIKSTAGEVLGWLSLYYLEPHDPGEQDLSLAEMATHIAGIAIENRRAQQALAEERNLLRTVIDTIPDLVYAKDRESRFIFHNDALSTITADALAERGVSSWVGLSDFDFSASEMARALYEEERRLMETGEPVLDAQSSYVGADGQLHWLSTTKVPLRDGDGHIIGLVGIGRDVTDIQVAQRDLAAERNLLRTVIDAIPDPVFAKDRESRFILYNRMVGRNAEKRLMELGLSGTWIGHTDFDFYPPEIAQRYYDEEQRVMATGEPLVDDEDLTTSPEGKPRWLLTTKVPLRDVDGDIVGMVGIGRDITTRVLMEQALRENEQMYRSLIEQSSDMIYLIRNNRFEIVNSAFEQAFGYTLDELQALEEGPLALVAPASRRVSQRRGHEVRDGRYDTLPPRYEFTALRRDGTQFEVEASMTYVPHHDGVATQGILRDVTERKAAEAAMRRLNEELEQRVADRTAEIQEQHQRIAAILDSVADAVIVTDLSGAVVLTNPVARRLMGETAVEIEVDVSRRIMEVVARLAVQGAATDTEVIEITGRTFEAKAAKVLADGQALGAVIVLRDITRLQELDRLKTQFVDTVSHELRTPLSNIRLYLSLLRRGRTERQGDYIGVMERESTRLERLIGDLLDISRLESAGGGRRREVVDMQALVTQVVENNTAQAEDKQLTLTYHPAPGLPLPPLWADRDQMVQMLTNLVANAIFYTPEGGAIELQSRQGVMGDSSGIAEDDETPAIILEVRDSGIGIAAEDLTHIFDRFFRGQNALAEQVPGTGLGLSITREIVERHYGKIEVESHLNEGSVFRVYLPLMASEHPST